mmetsp:Transcript_7230/g.13367  ORF Transcript_7230/g.13367 Transcript_7230/m.13367 type:complete len:526 (-) Transcript_7230:839-2416(-)
MHQSSLEGFDLFATSPAERGKEIVHKLLRLTSSLLFFKKLAAKHGTKVHTACVKVMMIENVPQGEAIVRFGDAGDCTYVLVEGRASVLIPFRFNSFKSLKNLSINFDEDLISQVVGSSEQQEKVQGLLSMCENPEQSIEEIRFREVGHVEAGESFGELSLLTNKPRAATILAQTDCKLLKLTKKDYQQILQRLEHQKIERRIAFLKSLTVFSKWTWESLLKLTYFLSSVKYRQGGVVFKEGSPSDEVYIVKSGEFKFYKQIHPKASVIAQPTSPSLRRKSPVKLHTEIKLPKEIFGVDDAIEGRERGMTCECSSTQGSLYVLSKKDFIDQIQKSDSWSYLVQLHSHQEAWRECKLERINRAEEHFNQLHQTSQMYKAKEHSSPMSMDRKAMRSKTFQSTLSHSPLHQSAVQRRLKIDVEPLTPVRAMRERSMTSRTQLTIAFDSTLDHNATTAMKAMLETKTEFKWKLVPLPRKASPSFKSSKLPPNFFASGKKAVSTRYFNSPKITGLKTPRGGKIQLRAKLRE